MLKRKSNRTKSLIPSSRSILKYLTRLVTFAGRYGWKALKFTYQLISKFLDSIIYSRKVLILGSGERLRSDVKHKEIWDYSQTAERNEVRKLTSRKDGDFWLGKFVFLHQNKAELRKDIWLSSGSLPQGVLCIGSQGSGKTELLLRSAENLMRKGHLVWVDAAGSMVNRLAPLAQKAGLEMACWDLTSSKHRVVWNFLEELSRFNPLDSTGVKGIRAISFALYGEINLADPNSNFWLLQRQWLTAIIGIIVEARRKKLVTIDPSYIPELIADRDAIRALINNLPQVQSQWGGDLATYLQLPDEDFSRHIGLFNERLGFLKEPDVKDICDGQSSIFLLSALNGEKKHAIIIGQPVFAGETGARLAGVMVSYIQNIIYRRALNRDRDWIPIHLICDEAPRLKNVNFKELVAIGRQFKVCVFLICQAFEQFADNAKEAAELCRTKIFLQGVSATSAKLLSDALGEFDRAIEIINNDGEVSHLDFRKAPVLGTREITDRPYCRLPSKRSGIIRIDTSSSAVSKTFLTDYSVEQE